MSRSPGQVPLQQEHHERDEPWTAGGVARDELLVFAGPWHQDEPNENRDAGHDSGTTVGVSGCAVVFSFAHLTIRNNSSVVVSYVL